MAASCPVISHYLVCDTVVWLDTSRQRLDVKRLFLIQAEWKQHLENQSYAEAMWKQRKNTEALYGCFEKLASGVLDIILQFQEGLELLSVFQVLEKDCSAQTEEFCQDSSELWKHFRKNYLEYRILSRKIEFPKEEERSCIRQVYGELVLFRTLCFCEYAQGNLAAEGQWEALLQKMYRFCVHGKKVSQAFQTLVSSFFSENYFWNYLLL
jgi:hypothetical protein